MQDSDFTPIRVTNLRGDLPISFDVYMRVAGKYILYCRQGDSFEGQRLERLKGKKLRFMYVKNESANAFRDYMHKNLEAAYGSAEGKPIELRAEILQGAMQAAGEDLMEDPGNKSLYEVVKSGGQRFAQFVHQEEGALKALLQIPNSDLSPSHHGTNVGSLAVALAKELGLADKIPLNLLMAGGVLHDMDHYLHSNVFAKPLQELAPQEMSQYKLHPHRGLQNLEAAGFYDKSVLAAVAQHHECLDGSGFPARLKEKELDPLGMIVATANSFDRLISFERLEPKEALKKILIEKLGQHPLEHLQALQHMLKKHEILT